jgi:hypothetical protein
VQQRQSIEESKSILETKTANTGTQDSKKFATKPAVNPKETAHLQPVTASQPKQDQVLPNVVDVKQEKELKPAMI